MKVSLISYTGVGMDQMYAADLMIFTKQTRLQMSPGLFNEIKAWPIEKKMEELEYMANTIPSSWEFVDYTFMIQDVTRAFTHQFVRTRQGSYAQQTMRVLNVEGFGYGTGPTIQERELLNASYQCFMDECNEFYKYLIDNGAKIEDARGVLPTNIHTNIVAKFNLRTLSELAMKRASSRTQGEYRDVLGDMIVEVLQVHPWAHLFLRNKKMEAAKKLEELINYAPVEEHERIFFLKQLDILRGN